MKAAVEEKKERKVATRKFRGKEREREIQRKRDGEKVEKEEEGREERGRSSASFVTSSSLVSAETKRGVGEATHSSEKIMQTVRKRRSIPKVRVRA